MIAGFVDENAEKFSVQKAVKLFFAMLDLEGHLAPYTSGWRVIISAKGFSLGHLTRITANMGIVRKVICYLQVSSLSLYRDCIFSYCIFRALWESEGC